MQPDDFATPPFPNDAQALLGLALRGRVRRPGALQPLAEHMRRVAAEDAAALGRAEVVLGWAQLALWQRAEARQTALRAEQHLKRCADPGAQALGHDLFAQLAHVGGHYEQAVAHAMTVMACPEGARRPQEWSATMTRLGSSNERLGRQDEALRWHYRGLPFAAASGDPLAYASALGSVGGLQLSLLNVEEAAALCGQAWDLVRDSGPGSTWGMCATNWAMVLMLQKRYPEAMPLADSILVADEALGSYNRHVRWTLLGELMAHAGQVVRAQGLLDQGLAQYPHGPEPPLNWVRAQATLCNAVGQHARALALCQSALTGERLSKLSQTDDDFDLMRLHAEAAVAHEAQGDLANALLSERAALKVERRMGVAAMQARRLTMQIQSEVDAARRERDSALQREQEAALERGRLSVLNAQLEEVSRAKSRFLAAASHDLRQPLHALGLQLAHLRSGVDGVVRDAVEQRMERALGSLTHMFDTLLDLSRMDAGVLTPRPQRLPLLPLLVRLVDELTPVAQARGLRLSLHALGERCTETDPALLETLLRNLLANALKYTVQGGVLLALRQRAGCLTLEVWDSGVGVAAAERERIFDEFYQVGPARPDHSQGLGLGLSIVKRLSALLGHRLQLDSEPGRGTRFRLWLPLAGAAEASASSPVSPAAGPPQQTALQGAVLSAPQEPSPALPWPQPAPSQQRLRVGVLEDDAEVRDSLVALLRRWGHGVRAGRCAAELIGAAGAEWQPDVLIADYSLGAGHTGDREVAQVRLALGWPVPALIVSGDTGADHLRALAACGLPWLMKPLQPPRLRAWLLARSDAAAVNLHAA